MQSKGFAKESNKMELFKNKKGNLAIETIMIMLALFIFALCSILSITAWNVFDDSIQNMDNETVSQDVKDQISGLGYLVLWGDKLFVIFFVILLISYIIASVTLPIEKPIYLIIFLVILVFITIVAMILSNSWAYLIENPNLIAAAGELKFTDFFMTYLPIIMFIIGIIGALLFYTRKETSFSIGGDTRGFE
ncbi:MAG: hypothetical protein KAU20_07830 [Nanoarchaeota archaeon]|nr:hypothetical protein [Nanoarchaeota archaeon]